MKEKGKLNSNILNLYKPLGISPLDLIKVFKDKYPYLRGKKMTYAGRLDPMAEGVVLVLVDEELKKFHQHLKYNKKYRAQITFGFETDTYDILGLPKLIDCSPLDKKEIKETINSFQDQFKFKIPPFSGYNMKGKPLFKWALEGKLDEINIPEKIVKINDIKINSIGEITKESFSNLVNNKIKRVIGNFRQERILKEWNQLFSENIIENKIQIINLEMDVGSGFYVRSFAHKIGKILNRGGILSSLTRTQVGKWTINDSIKI
jgi:tRNA pseudouridine55 synthase